jgi:tmRNA-binding protein
MDNDLWEKSKYVNADGELKWKIALIEEEVCPLLVKILFNGRTHIGSVVFWETCQIKMIFLEQSKRREKDRRHKLREVNGGETKTSKKKTGAPKKENNSVFEGYIQII